MMNDIVQQHAHLAMKMAFYPVLFGASSIPFIPPNLPHNIFWMVGAAVGAGLGKLLVEKGFKQGGLPKRFASLAFCTLAGGLGGFTLAFPTALYCVRWINPTSRNEKPPRPTR